MGSLFIILLSCKDNKNQDPKFVNLPVPINQQIKFDPKNAEIYCLCFKEGGLSLAGDEITSLVQVLIGKFFSRKSISSDTISPKIDYEPQLKSRPSTPSSLPAPINSVYVLRKPTSPESVRPPNSEYQIHPIDTLNQVNKSSAQKIVIVPLNSIPLIPVHGTRYKEIGRHNNYAILEGHEVFKADNLHLNSDQKQNLANIEMRGVINDINSRESMYSFISRSDFTKLNKNTGFEFENNKQQLLDVYHGFIDLSDDFSVNISQRLHKIIELAYFDHERFSQNLRKNLKIEGALQELDNHPVQFLGKGTFGKVELITSMDAETQTIIHIAKKTIIARDENYQPAQAELNLLLELQDLPVIQTYGGGLIHGASVPSLKGSVSPDSSLSSRDSSSPGSSLSSLPSPESSLGSNANTADFVKQLENMRNIYKNTTHQDGGVVPKVPSPIVVSNPDRFVIFMEAAKEFKSHPYTDSEVKSVFLSLNELHSRGIYHRDIKAPNMLVNSVGKIVFSDLGTAVKITDGSKLPDITGSPQHTAPELWGKGYETIQGLGAADIWSTGVMEVGRRYKSSISRIYKLDENKDAITNGIYSGFTELPQMIRATYTGEIRTRMKDVIANHINDAQSGFIHVADDLLFRSTRMDPNMRPTSTEIADLYKALDLRISFEQWKINQMRNGSKKWQEIGRRNNGKWEWTEVDIPMPGSPRVIKIEESSGESI